LTLFSRSPRPFLLRILVLPAITLLAAGCGANQKGTSTPEPAASTAAISVKSAAAVERPIRRFIGVTGTLMAQEQADVAAEIAGRVVATPVERGTAVADGAPLVRIADTEVDAQLQEAEANARQIEARLALTDGGGFQIDRVPEVANARAAYDLGQAEFERAQSLVDKRLLSQADFDRSRTQAEASRRQYEIARNAAEQQYQSLLAARARMTLARKAAADTVVRAPFAGVVEQRLVSVGDYVTRGTKVASVMRINPLRVELTVPEQYISQVSAGRAVSLEVDAYPGETFEGLIRFVSPALKADTRALVVEAIVSNEAGRLKPGFFATARVEEATERPAILVPSTAVRVVSGSPRLYVIAGGRAEERIVTSGQAVGDLVEITSGLKAGEVVAATNVTQLVDGAQVAEAR